MLAYLQRRPWLLATVLAADGLANLATSLLKGATDRDRPPLLHPEPAPLVHLPSSSSFPSGHAAVSFACALVLARAAPRLAAPLFALAAAVAFSRVYVGVHFPADVLAGALLGLVLGWPLSALERRRPGAARAPRPPAGARRR